MASRRSSSKNGLPITKSTPVSGSPEDFDIKPLPEIIRTRWFGNRCLMAAASASPFISGMEKSVVTRSNLPGSSRVRASLPLLAVWTLCPSCSSIILMASLTVGFVVHHQNLPYRISLVNFFGLQNEKNYDPFHRRPALVIHI